MNDQLANIPTDKDMAVLAELRATMDGHECVHQVRIWDGIRGESLIFAAEDVSDRTHAQLEDLARSSPLILDDSQITIARSNSGFVWVYFDFSEPDD